MKQVPAGTKVDIDPETGAMKRLSGDTRTNPYDLFALETALQLREKLGGTVTVLTMGQMHQIGLSGRTVRPRLIITCEPGALLLDVQAAAVTATSIPRCCAEPI